MKLRDILSEKKASILERWFDKILETYPTEATGFLRNKKKQFTNPVGYTFSQGLESLFNELIEERDLDLDKLSPVLEDILRIRAVQGLSPSQELAFLFHLKGMVRDALEGGGTSDAEGLERLDSKIDELALVSFDIYMKCREKIYELKANELKNMTYRLLQRANLVSEVKEE